MPRQDRKGWSLNVPSAAAVALPVLYHHSRLSIFQALDWASGSHRTRSMHTTLEKSRRINISQTMSANSTGQVATAARPGVLQCTLHIKSCTKQLLCSLIISVTNKNQFMKVCISVPLHRPSFWDRQGPGMSTSNKHRSPSPPGNATSRFHQERP